MAITINALTTGTGGLETTADASGSFSFQSDGSTIATVTSSGFSVTGTFNAGSLQVGGSDVVVDTDIGSTVPSVSGSGATGTWSVSISGNAATVTNGVYTTGSYANPSWITSLDDGKVLPTMTGNSGKYLTTDGTNSSWATIASSQWTTSGSDIYYNTGNVGIGTSSPTTKLHVSDTGTGTLISSSSDTTNTGFSWSDGTISGVLVASGVGGTALYTQSNHPTVFGTNNTERMRIDSSGNVGIGTSTLATKLTVEGVKTNIDLDSNGILLIRDTTAYNSSPAAGLQFSVKYNAAGTTAAGLSIQGIKENATDGNYAQAMLFTTQAQGDSPRERMRITSTGNVNIGTSAAGYGDLTLLRQATTATNATLSLVSGTSGYGRLFFGDTQNAAGEYDGFIQYDQANRLMQFGTAQAERMRIDSSGNVGIGTSSPNKQLQIQYGSTNSGQLQITNNSTGTTATDGVLFGYDTLNDVVINNQEATATKFYTNSAERMRIDSSGNVGIGTSSPSSKLQVNGTCTATTFVGSLSGNATTATTATTATSAGTATRAYEWKGSGSTGNWNTHFQDTETQSATQIDLNGGTNCPTGGGWWFVQSFRHSNGGNYWGTQYALGWEDRAYQRYVRNVQAGSFGSWQLDTGCRAWVIFNGTGTVAIRGSGNVSSITDSGTGNYTVNFSTAMIDANYSAPASAGHTAYNTTRTPLCWSFATTSVSVGTVTSGGTASDAEDVSVAIFR